jgi:hypothetical protein
VTDREARLLVGNPTPERAPGLAIDGIALHRIRQVCLVAAGRELARWEVSPRGYHALACQPFHLAAGLHELVLESDKTSRPRSPLAAAGICDFGPYSLNVDRVELDASDSIAAWRSGSRTVGRLAQRSHDPGGALSADSARATAEHNWAEKRPHPARPEVSLGLDRQPA